MADMEELEREREETYLKLFYNRHPGLGAIELGDTSPALATDCLLEAERDQSPHVSSPSSSSLLVPEVFSIETLFSNNQAGDNSLLGTHAANITVQWCCSQHFPVVRSSSWADKICSYLGEFYRNRVFSISWNRSWKLSEHTLLSCLENDCAMMHRGGQRLQQ